MLRRKTFLLAVRTAALVTIATGSPANADSTGMFNYSVGNCGYGWRQYCTGYGQGVPVGLASLTVTVTCSANSPFVVDRTGVGCYLRGLNDRQKYLESGPLFVTGNTAEVTKAGSVPFQGYELCVGGGYSTSFGEFRAVQNYVCQ